MRYSPRRARLRYHGRGCLPPCRTSAACIDVDGHCNPPGSICGRKPVWRRVGPNLRTQRSGSIRSLRWATCLQARKASSGRRSSGPSRSRTAHHTASPATYACPYSVRILPNEHPLMWGVRGPRSCHILGTAVLEMPLILTGARVLWLMASGEISCAILAIPFLRPTAPKAYCRRFSPWLRSCS
jgi:hypothetical protein